MNGDEERQALFAHRAAHPHFHAMIAPGLDRFNDERGGRSDRRYIRQQVHLISGNRHARGADCARDVCCRDGDVLLRGRDGGCHRTGQNKYRDRPQALHFWTGLLRQLIQPLQHFIGCFHHP